MTTLTTVLARPLRILFALAGLALALLLIVANPAPVGAVSAPRGPQAAQPAECDDDDAEDGDIEDGEDTVEAAENDCIDAEDEPEFDDVPVGSGHLAGIEWLAEFGISKGCGNGKGFCPNKPVTRAEMATFIYRLSGSDPSTPPSLDAISLDGTSAAEYEAQIAELEQRIEALEALVLQAAQ